MSMWSIIASVVAVAVRALPSATRRNCAMPVGYGVRVEQGDHLPAGVRRADVPRSGWRTAQERSLGRHHESPIAMPTGARGPVRSSRELSRREHGRCGGPTLGQAALQGLELIGLSTPHERRATSRCWRSCPELNFLIPSSDPSSPSFQRRGQTARFAYVVTGSWGVSLLSARSTANGTGRSERTSATTSGRRPSGQARTSARNHLPAWRPPDHRRCWRSRSSGLRDAKRDADCSHGHLEELRRAR